MRKKRIAIHSILFSVLVTMLLTVLLIAFSGFFMVVDSAPLVSAASHEEKCCISVLGGCEPLFDVAKEAECTAKGGQISTSACDEVINAPRCSVGCCATHGGALQTPQFKLQCDNAGGTFLNARAFEPTPPAGLCGGLLGCSADNECPANTRCENSICIPGVRAAVSRCENTQLDAGESDVDCGGTCPPCDTGKRCSTDNDCKAGLKCDAATHQCVAHVTDCRNGVVDAGEDCDFDAGSSRVLFKAGVTSCQQLDAPSGEKFAGGTLACNSFCRFNTNTCIPPLPPEQRRTAPSGVCGDGKLNTPNEAFFAETCEIGVEYANRCAAGTVCGCEIAENCAPTDCACTPACESPAPAITGFEMRADTVRLEWLIPGSQPLCRITNQHVLRCERGVGNECPNLPPEQWERSADISPARNRAEQPTQGKKNLCFAVEVTYENHENGRDGSARSTQVSDFQCLDGCTEGQRFCDETDAEKRNTRICSGGIFRSGEQCDAGTYCAEPTAGTIECRAPQPCAQCSGAFQIFAGVLFDIPGLAAAAQQKCEQLTGCAYDKSEKTVNQFRDCAGVQNCYSYRSKYACENDEAHCAVAANGCAWQTVNRELGIGVCRPADEEKQQCEACNERSYEQSSNPLFAGCGRQTCELFGEGCYFSDLPGQCKPQHALGCNDYNNRKQAQARKECIGDNRGRRGEQQVEVDVRYGSPDGAPDTMRTGGTNRITQRSRDRFQFGLCSFAASGPGERCFKDADGNGVDDCSFAADPDACNTDFIPPETSLSLGQVKLDADGNIKIGKFLDIPVQVNEPASTFFCIDHTCYPKNYTMCRIQRVLAPGDSTATRLNFYSQDRANNIEEVKHRDIMVNVNPPRKVRDDILRLSPDSPRQIVVDLNYTNDVMCNARLTDLKGNEMPADDTPQALLHSNSVVNEHGRNFQREYHNLLDDIYVFTYNCENDFGNADEGQEVQIIDTNKIHILSGTFGGSEPIISASNIIAHVTTDEPATCYIKPMGTNRDFSPFSAADAMEMQADSERKEHNKNVDLMDDLNIFQVACRFDGRDSLEGNRADRIVISKDVFPPKMTFFGSIDKSIILEPGDYGTAQSVFLYCSDSRIKEQYGLHGLDYGCGEVSMSVNGVQASHSFGDEKEGFVPPFVPFVAGNALSGGTASLEVSSLRARDRQNHESAQFERRPFRIRVADVGDGSIHDTASVSLQDELGKDIPVDTPPHIPKGIYYLRINTGRLASIDNFGATIKVIGMVEEAGVVTSEPEREIGRLQARSCELETPSTIRCVIDVHQLALEEPGADEKDMYQMTFAFGAVNVIEKGTECFAGERPRILLAMPVQELRVMLVTKTPDLVLEPVFSPDFFDGGAAWEAFMEQHNYSVQFYPEEGRAYTNQRELFVTGKMKHPDVTEKIEYYTAPCSGVLAKQKEFRPGERVGNILAASSVNPPVRVTNRLSINTLPIPNMEGAFLQFNSPVDEHGDIIHEYARKAYGAFRHYYAIERVEAGTPSTLHLSSPIEEVPARIAGQAGIPITLFDNAAEPERFGESVRLQEGCNLFAARGIGSGGGGEVTVSAPQPDPAALAGIIVDTEGPRVIQNIPPEGTSNEDIENISIVVEELRGDGVEATLLPESVSVTLIPLRSGEDTSGGAGGGAAGGGATGGGAGAEPLVIDGPGCEGNACSGIKDDVSYQYMLVTDQLINEDTSVFVEGLEKESVLTALDWNGLHDAFIAAAGNAGGAAGGGRGGGAAGEIISARIGDRGGSMGIQTEEQGDLMRHTITYRHGEVLEGGYLVVFEGRDKAGNRLAATQAGKPSWSFNVDDGTPAPPEWEFLAPAVKHEETFYANTNVNVKIDYSETPEPVSIGETNPGGTINGALFVKRFDAPLGEEDPLPALCERARHNVFVCNTRDFTPAQFNRAYTLIVEARKHLSNEVEGPAARHVSQTLVMDNQPPQILAYEYPEAVAYNGRLRIELQVRDSGFDLAGRAVLDVTGRPDLRREITLTQLEHQPGTERYVFEWDLEPERFHIRDESALSRPNSFTIFIDDYAGNAPSAVLARALRLDFRGPDEDDWKVDIQTPFSVPAEQKYFTRNATVRINGSFSDDDICPDCIFITPGNYLPATDSYDSQQIATVLALPEKRYVTGLRLKAREGEIINQTYTITIKDIAGFSKTRTFTIFTDRRPPEQVSVRII